MINLGIYNRLQAVRESPYGMYLADEEGNEVLLPRKYVPADLAISVSIDVFIYKDGEERLVATTLQPKIKLNEYAFLKVKMVDHNGAYLDWGLEKDLFVPFREQKQNMVEGLSYIVYLYLDEQSDRLTASAKIENSLNNENLTVKTGEEVSLLIWDQTDLGTKVIINNLYEGLIYKSEQFKKLRKGALMAGYIDKIRDDHKIDVRLDKRGYAHVEPNAEKIMQRLRNSDGFLPLNDKSDPEIIKAQLEMSKKTFKKAVGALYKQNLIILEEAGIRLIEKS